MTLMILQVALSSQVVLESFLKSAAQIRLKDYCKTRKLNLKVTKTLTYAERDNKKFGFALMYLSTFIINVYVSV